MALTRAFRETVRERAQSDPDFRIGLLTEAAECLLNNEVGVAKPCCATTSTRQSVFRNWPA